MAQIALKNEGSNRVEIEWYSDPLQYLNITFRRADGSDIPSIPYGLLFAPYAPAPQVLRLLPGEIYQRTVNLLAVVKEGEVSAGRYSLRAIYNYDGITAISDTVEISIVK